MKIAFVIQDMFARGAQCVTARLIRGFVARGFQVDLIVSKIHSDGVAAGDRTSFEVPPEVNWIYLKGRKARNNVGELRQYLKTTNAKAVVVMCIGYAIAVRLARMGLRKCPTLAYVEHDIPGVSVMGEVRKSPAKWSLKGLYSGWLWAGFDRILVVTKAAIGDFRRMNPWLGIDKVTCVANPVVESDEIGIMPERSAEACMSFVAAGAFHPNKDHLMLIEAMRSVVDRGVKARLVIYGRGELESTYRQAIRKLGLEGVVEIGGYTTALGEILRKTDVLVSSSLAESFGLTLVEALAAGAQVVATDCPFGPREILDGGRYGMLVPPHDVEAMADALVSVSTQSRRTAAAESWRRYTVARAVDDYCRRLGL